MTFTDNSRYEGYWKEGKQQGEGYQTYFTGDFVVGEYKDDLMNG